MRHMVLEDGLAFGVLLHRSGSASSREGTSRTYSELLSADLDFPFALCFVACLLMEDYVCIIT